MTSICPIIRISNRISGRAPVCRDAAVLDTGHNLRIYDSIAPISAIWDSIVPAQDPYWSSAFLSNIEKRPPGDYQFRYLIFYQKDQPIGVAYAQITEFSAWQSIRGDVREEERKAPIPLFRHWLAKKLRLNVLILGNTLVSGPYAYFFKTGYTKVADRIREASDLLINSLEKEGLPIHMVAVKDLEGNQTSDWTGYSSEWKQVCFQPRMVIRIDENWRSAEDYVSAMQSKYRVRYRRARKKLGEITSRRLRLDELEHFQDNMYGLYRSVAEQSGFNMVELSRDYWLKLAQLFGDDFSVRGYFLGDQMVGFYSMLRGDHAIWHANYLGYDQELNHHHQLYLNMLYDMVESAIAGHAVELDFSRTALEIKSSVGAEPQDLFCYFRHRSPLVNPFIPWITQVISPDEEWAQRHPFRAEK